MGFLVDVANSRCGNGLGSRPAGGEEREGDHHDWIPGLRGFFGGIPKIHRSSHPSNRRGYHSPMPRYVAFLRAINVGGHTVPMAKLIQLFQDLDCTDVTSFIASGNIIFTSDTRPALLEKQLDRHLEAELGFPAESFVRPIPALAAVLAGIPFSETELESGFALMVGFLRASRKAGLADDVAELSGPRDRLVLDGDTLYWLRLVQDSDPRLSRKLDKVLGAPITFRNVNTVRRILDRLRAERSNPGNK